MKCYDCGKEIEQAKIITRKGLAFCSDICFNQYDENQLPEEIRLAGSYLQEEYQLEINGDAALIITKPLDDHGTIFGKIIQEAYLPMQETIQARNLALIQGKSRLETLVTINETEKYKYPSEPDEKRSYDKKITILLSRKGSQIVIDRII